MSEVIMIDPQLVKERLEKMVSSVTEKRNLVDLIMDVIDDTYICKIPRTEWVRIFKERNPFE